ncbi:acyl-CoA dehydrogenase family protein, partial [Azospirillum sp. INR13]|uniref:acyl-CoA dehydrogenase family protein n=1 Tax=Azospirillum sp. INR13 TaxID=2596919 RepID=UPI0019D50201
MTLAFAPELESFRAEAAAWLEEQLSGPFKDLRGLHNHVDAIERRREWEERLGAARWSCIGWPQAFGGRDATIAEQVVFAEEYARAGAPARIGHIGIELAGPTLLAFGSEEQKQRFLPDIAGGRSIWCQGYSEPNAGSDLSNVRTKARRDGDRYLIDGQKIWTSMGSIADWCFVLCRTEVGSADRRGCRSCWWICTSRASPYGRSGRSPASPSSARCSSTGRGQGLRPCGEEGQGWKVAMGLLGFERGVSTLAQQMHFRTELDELIATAKANGKAADPLIRQRLAQAHIGLKIMRYNALRMLANAESGQLSRRPIPTSSTGPPGT